MTAFPQLGIPYGFTRTLRADVRVRLRGDMKLEREFAGGRIRHAFEIPWRFLPAQDRQTLDEWFASCRGRITGDIAFTDPWENVTYTCRLDTDELELSAPVSTRWAATLRLVECADWKPLKPAVPAFPATVPFQLPYWTAKRYRTVVEAAPDGTEKRFEDFPTPIRRWRAGGGALTDAQVSALLACWEGNCGPWRGFSFTDADGETMPHCRFADPEIAHTVVARNRSGFIHSCRVAIEELKA